MHVDARHGISSVFGCKNGVVAMLASDSANGSQFLLTCDGAGWDPRSWHPLAWVASLWESC